VISRYTLSDGYSLSRIIKGGWHLAGDHGAIDPQQAIKDMAVFVEAGITTFDCADIYTGVEELIGSFRHTYPALASRVQVHTKFVPDLSDLHTLDGRYVENIIDRSLKRLGVERLDLVQFHWWDFNVPRYVETAFELDRLRRAGKIAHVGVTNFDTKRLDDVVSAGIPVVSHQLQYSLIDDRPTTQCSNIATPTTSYCCATGRWAAASCPSAGWANPSRAAPPLDNPTSKIVRWSSTN
jgi:aryl-alcohol dehydrogenase-like predicted oxidoreductase